MLSSAVSVSCSGSWEAVLMFCQRFEVKFRESNPRGELWGLWLGLGPALERPRNARGMPAECRGMA